MHTISSNHPDSNVDSLTGSTDFNSANSDLSHCRTACHPGDALSSRKVSGSASGIPAELSSEGSTSGSPDTQLIARVLNGETRAYEEFVERYRRFVYALLQRRGLSVQEREDIYQEVYVRLWQHDLRGIRRWQATGMREFKPYLSAVIRRLIYDHYRLKAKQPLLAPDSKKMMGEEIPPHILEGGMWHEEISDFDGILLHKEQRDILRQAIARLSTRDANIICRRYFADESYQEIGTALGMTTDNVGVTLAHIRKRLRKHLNTLGIEVFEEFVAKQEPPSQAMKRKK